MDFVSKKLTSITGESLSTVQKLSSKRASSPETATDQPDSSQPAIPLKQYHPVTNRGSSAPSAPPPVTQAFGGDFQLYSRDPPPPIGFKIDPSAQIVQQQQDQPQHHDSEESLYDGGTWTRCWYPRVMTLCLVRLLLFVGKLYGDFEAAKIFYGIPRLTGFFIISAATLLLPTIVFTLYRVSRYLQITLPSSRAVPQLDSTSPTNQNSKCRDNSDSRDDDQQIRRSLMGSPSPEEQPTTSNKTEDEGLVTTRQTPTSVGSAQQKETVVVTLEAGLERQLSSTTDKEGIKIILGALEQLVHGLLFIFWQFKRQVDVISYLNQRLCVWRKPKILEQDELATLRTGSDGLEWFQDFYAAFLAILVQVYTLGAHWSGHYQAATDQALIKSESIPNLGSSKVDMKSGEPIISNAAQALSNLLKIHVDAGGQIPENRDLLFASELIVSSTLVFSLLIAVKRRDDGPLTLALSILGWGSLFAARIIVIALAFVHLGWPLMLSLVTLHIVGITSWIYKIAIDSHNDKPGESDQIEWEPDSTPETNQQSSTQVTPEINDKPQSEPKSQIQNIQRWTYLEHITLLSQILTLFSIPSLFYWPIMFNLKLHYRPLKYLVLILSENFLLIPAIWLSISKLNETSPSQWYLLCAVAGFSVMGFLFVGLYVLCKPSLTEYFARADEILNNAKQAGIYYEFCSRVFKMPDLSRESFRRLMRQTEVQEEA